MDEKRSIEQCLRLFNVARELAAPVIDAASAADVPTDHNQAVSDLDMAVRAAIEDCEQLLGGDAR